MKVRVVLTLDVDPEKFRYWHPLAVEREGGVREAARSFVQDAVQGSPAARNESIRSVTLAEQSNTDR